ncbi:hypothetical protein [Akkermansia sp.]|nr:hypothetical protein [Akkermansia sp.]MBD9270537.1 hypothetical protein [Akkermansia sp.]MEE0763559.1 hypothetical protein [Akkermansia sp.]
MLAWCGICCSLAEDYPFPGEREWVSKLGDVVKGTFQSCTGTKVAVKVGRKRVEIPLNRLDEEDAALVRSLTGTTARRDIKLAETFWPYIMKELEKVTWIPVERDISPRFSGAARKAATKTVAGMRKVDGFSCTTSLTSIRGNPFLIREYYRPQVRPASGGGPKNFDMILENGEVYACYDTGKGLLAPEKHLLEARTEMRGPVSSLLPAGEKIAARESKTFSNADYSLSMAKNSVKGGYETCKPNFLTRKILSFQWNAEGKMVCGVMKLEYDNARVAVLFDAEKKIMNAPGLGYAVMISRMNKKSRDPKVKDEHYYHVGLAADGLPVYHHEGPENEAGMDPLRYGELRESEKKVIAEKEKERERAFRAKLEARQRLVESARKRNG